MLHPIYMYKL